jgi:hypothetical protein
VNVSITGTNTEWHNPRHTTNDGPVEGYFIEKRAIVDTMRIGLTSADMHIPEMLGDG